MKLGTLDDRELNLALNESAFEVSHRWQSPQPGLNLLTLELTAKAEPALPELTLKWRIPDIDIQGQWHPCARDTKHLMPPWNGWYSFNATNNAPVFCLYNGQGRTRFLTALSDVVNTTGIFCATREGLHSDFEIGVHTKPEPHTETRHYSLTIRIDTRDQDFSAALNGIARWWEELGHKPRAIPPHAREPHFSSWYLFHDNVKPADLIAEAKTAAEIGCKVYLLDDGWQKDDNARDKDRTLGDWISRGLGDARAFADAIHELGLKLVMWFATPFVTEGSQTWKKVGDLCFDSQGDWHCLDFRYPAAREHIAELLADRFKSWNLDGLKIDFIDSLPKEGLDPRPNDARRDTQSRSEGTVRMLDTLFTKLTEVRPDPLLEFRQGYIGPVMRKYASAFRAFDCPLDSINNRLLTTDIRLLCGNTPVHADMFIWDIDEPVEVAALQFANILFSVPQISTSIRQLPMDHLAMLKFYVAFWLKHRHVLLDGAFTAHHPELNYPLLTAQTRDEWIAVAYAPMTVTLPTGKKRWTLVNASGRANLVVTGDIGNCRGVITDCMGNAQQGQQWSVGPATLLPIPPSGTWSAK